MIVEFLEWLSDRLPCRLINGDANEPYLERYWVGSFFGMRIYIHRFVASDPDRGLHDHPWGWGFSTVLSGSYSEEYESFGKIETRKINWFNWIPGYKWHRVKYEGTEPVWTLFIRGPSRKVWGFKQADPYYIDSDRFIHKWISGAIVRSSGRKWHKTAKKGRELKQRL